MQHISDEILRKLAQQESLKEQLKNALA